MMDIGKKDSPKLTFELHQLMAKQLKACGVNLDYSPCCDIWSNRENKVIGDRAFGRTPQIVEKHVSAAIRGMQSENVLTCAKHFPGHGNTLKDSHYDLPFVKKSLKELEEFELIPFQKASKSRVEFMMMAHLVVDAIDPDNPCTLSKKAYRYLRDSVKYKNIIITDDMEMQAITKGNGHANAAVKALNAGADILLYRSMDACKEAIEGVLAALKSGQITLATLSDRIDRVMDCKKRYFSEYTPIYIPDIDKVFNEEENSRLLSQVTSEYNFPYFSDLDSFPKI
jgi:beta-N-acetylhexosaminidase